MQARAVTSFSLVVAREEVNVVTVEVRDAIDALSACVALTRLVIAATVSLWTSVALFSWNPADRAVWEESTSSACVMKNSVLNCVQVF